MNQDYDKTEKGVQARECCKNNKNTGKHVSPFDTYALAGNEQKDDFTNQTIPSDKDVRNAKDWVDFNEK